MAQDTQQRAAVVEEMPEFGLGTWENEDPSACADSVRTALEMGYRHIDTAQIYENEDAVGDGIAAADVDREDVFLATKVWTSELGDGDVAPATEQSLEKLGVDYVDLLYVHWPANQYDATETLAALADLQADGVTERIGVSNFEPRHLDEAEDVLGELPFANQVEFHPLLQQEELREYADGEDIELVAYSPLARGEVFDVPEIQAVAEKHGVSEAQVSLAWVRRKGVTAIPKATGEDHIADNWASLDLELDDEDVAKIDGIDRRERQVDPEFGPWN
ncbi:MULTISPECIES: aldo/keto reductase [Halobacterium]|nr:MULTISPECIES: aldo/keto reductase [Halobacterium]MBB6089839.1 2,5-diketo-D-gluconate reductase B [Halobacterium salinarum]MDL0120554.1 aldo/keto reductase [Halobacterium salinarum]MDL0122500.1 aldo/keto reductase [Halobacterium salinarum]MDL0125193.1 aldo/keto reductase [Halobacterium salinarum]MDL0128654.1 aldo/keto reductase [Halobacterium salinarum]